MQESLSKLRGDLSASAMLVGFSDNGWAKIDIEGEDREILQEIISRGLGRAQADLAQIEKQGNYSGVVNTVGTDLAVDIGIEKPSPLNVVVSSRALRRNFATESYSLVRRSRNTIVFTRVANWRFALCDWNETQEGLKDGWLIHR